MGVNASSCCENREGQVPAEVVGAVRYSEEKEDKDDLESFPSQNSHLSQHTVWPSFGSEHDLPIVIPRRSSRRSKHSSLSSELEMVVASMSSDLPMVQRAITFQVEEALARGIPVASTLRDFGYLWKTSPLELEEDSRTNLWSKAQPVRSFDVFFSHTWRTPGRRKVLSLLFQYGGRTVGVNLFVFVTLVVLLSARGMLPMVELTWPVNAVGFKASCPFTPWAYLTGTLTTLISLFMSPYCICTRCSSKAFLDVVSIHQTDKTMKQRGVYGLGGFLSISQEMRVLWSAPYLTRLWCVFELAAFRKANPSRPLNLKPLFVESQVLLLMLTSGLCCGAYIAVRTGHGIIVLANLAMAPFLILAHTNRKFMREEKQLTESLENFDVKDAECHLEADRAFVSLAIASWYGSEEAFNEYVRGPLRRELLAASGLDLPMSYALLIAVSPFCMAIDVVVSMIVAGAPVDAVLAAFISLGLGVTLFWSMFCVKVMWSLCSRWSSPGATRVSDLSVSLLIFLITILLMAAGSGAVNYLMSVSLVGAMVVGVLSAVFTCAAYGCVQHFSVTDVR